MKDGRRRSMIANIFARAHNQYFLSRIFAVKYEGANREEGGGWERATEYIHRKTVNQSDSELRSGIPGRSSERRVLPFLGGKIFRENH